MERVKCEGIEGEEEEEATAEVEEAEWMEREKDDDDIDDGMSAYAYRATNWQVSVLAVGNGWMRKVGDSVGRGCNKGRPRIIFMATTY